MSVPRRQTLFVAASSLVVLLCTAVLVWAPQPELVSSLPAFSTASVPYRAYVIFRDGDCDGNLSFVQLFQRPRYRAAFHLTGVLLDAAPDDPDVRSKLERSGVTMDMARADRALRRAVAQLSPEPGPLLVVVDRDGRLRVVSMTPKSPSETRQFIALLNSFAAAEPS
jgi:hypothetical protein